jgi:hypothetical protein
MRNPFIDFTTKYDLRIGGFTTGWDEIDVQRMKYNSLGQNANRINIYKIKRSLYYR